MAWISEVISRGTTMSGSTTTYYIALVVAILAFTEFVVFAVYQVILLGNTGYSIGKQTMGLRALSAKTGL